MKSRNEIILIMEKFKKFEIRNSLKKLNGGGIQGSDLIGTNGIQGSDVIVTGIQGSD